MPQFSHVLPIRCPLSGVKCSQVWGIMCSCPFPSLLTALASPERRAQAPWPLEVDSEIVPTCEKPLKE